MWGTYGGISEHDMVSSCRSNDSQPTTRFNTLIEEMNSEVSMEY